MIQGIVLQDAPHGRLSERRKRHVLYKASKCPECGSSFLPLSKDQVNCSQACYKAALNRELKRGRQAYALLYNWRGNRKDAKRMLRGLCRVVAQWAEDDRAAGRGLPPLNATQKHLATEEARHD